MTKNKFDIFDHDRFVDSADTDESSELGSFSGPLREERVVQGVPLFALWLCAAVRDGRVRVTVEFTVAVPVIYEISQGRPLLVETEVGTGGQTVVSVTFTPLTKAPHIEFSVLKSERAITGAPPGGDRQILGLRADTGVNGSPGVTSWEDTTPGAPNASPFNAIGLSPTLIDSDPDFNNEPTIQFSANQRLEYSGAILDFAALAKGPTLTICVTHAPDDTLSSVGTLLSNALGGASGTAIRILETYETKYETSNGVDGVFEVTSVEPIQKAMVSIWTVVFSDGVIPGQSIGRQQGLTLSSDPALIEPFFDPTDLLNIGGDPDGSNSYAGRIADIRIFSPQLSIAEMQDYVDYAVLRFGVDDTTFRNNAETSNLLYLTAQRGIVTNPGAATNYTGVGSGVNVDAAEYVNSPQLASTGSGTGVVLTSFFVLGGGGVIGILPGIRGTGHQIGDILTFLDVNPDDAVSIEVTEVNDEVISWTPVNNPGTGPFLGGEFQPVLNDYDLTNGKLTVRFRARQFQRSLISSDPAAFWRVLGGYGSFTVALVYRSSTGADGSRVANILRTADPGQNQAGFHFGKRSSDPGGPTEDKEVQVFVRNTLVNNWTTSILEDIEGGLYAHVHRYQVGANAISTLQREPPDVTGPAVGVVGEPGRTLTIGGAEDDLQVDDEPFLGDVVEIHVSTFSWTQEQVDNFMDWAEDKYQIGT